MAAKKKTSKKNATAKKKAPARKKPVGKKKAAKKAPARKKAAKKKAVAKKAPARKKAAKKKAVAKKAPARKKAAKKKAVAKKAEARKKPVAKNRAPARKTTAKKAQSSAKKTNARSSTKASTPRKRLTPSYEAPTSRRPIRRVGGMSRLEQLAAEREENPPKVKKMGARDREYFRRLLLNLRDHVVDEISFLAGNNLKSQNVATSSEDGTDNFNREFALKLVSSEQDLVYEIDEALNRIRNGQYGICQISGRAIERERLKVLPHARHCVEVQSELERGRTRYRPFGPTLSRSIGD